MLCRSSLHMSDVPAWPVRMQVFNKGTTWQGLQSACGLMGSGRHPACALPLISPPHLLVPCRL